MVDQCDLIVAAPSSFWGRLRGRVDIAAHLAAALAGKHGIPLGRAPWHCYWRMTKRAIQTQKSQNIVDFTSALEGQQILIVDDVITTGYTISKVAQEFHHQSLDFLTLANASQS
jgi:predicted amidophosphoribosyltransferase